MESEGRKRGWRERDSIQDFIVLNIISTLIFWGNFHRAKRSYKIRRLDILGRYHAKLILSTFRAFGKRSEFFSLSGNSAATHAIKNLPPAAPPTGVSYPPIFSNIQDSRINS
ncbi:hypothetical protein Pfo_027764 [Paulownia fortunei]|nr:hypothetical protein Pfo_027764 [Paulownia fortunei]